MVVERDEERLAALFDSYGHTRAVDLRNELVVAYMDLASSMAHRFGGRGEPMEDLEQVARFALIRAVERFDPGRGVPFAGFAIPTILGELKRYFRDRTWSGKVRRSTKELLPKVRVTTEVLEAELGRNPRPSEVAERLGVSLDDVVEALEAGRSYRAESLSTQRIAGGETLGATLASGVDDVQRSTDIMMLSALIGKLDDRKQQIIHGRFVDELSQDQIAKRLGISQMHVSRLLRAALDELSEIARSEQGES